MYLWFFETKLRCFFEVEEICIRLQFATVANGLEGTLPAASVSYVLACEHQQRNTNTHNNTNANITVVLKEISNYTIV